MSRIAESYWRALRDGGIVSTSNVLNAIVGIAGIRVVTELAPPAVFGTASLLLASLILGSQVLLGPITNTALRFQTEAADSDAFMRETMLWSIKSAVVLTSIIAIVTLIVILLDNPYRVLEISFVSVGWIWIQAIKNVLSSRAHAEARRVLFGVSQIIETLGVFVATCVALSLRADVASVIFGQLAGGAFAILYFLRSAPWRIWDSFHGEATEQRDVFKNRLLSYGLPFIPLSVLNWASNMTDRFVLVAFSGAIVTGQYIALFAVASRAMILCNGITADYFRPLVFQATNDADRKRAVGHCLSWIVCNLLLACAAMSFIAFAGKYVLLVLVAEEYRHGSVWILLCISAGYSVYGITQILETSLLAFSGPRQLFMPMGTGAIANVVFSMALVPDYGDIGAALGCMLSFLAQLAATAFQMYKTTTTKPLCA